MALHFPGSPLPYGSASGFSGPCRSTCWCKTGRNCISQLQAGLPCEEDLCIFLWWSYCNVNFGMVEACLPLPAETRNCGAYRIKLKSPDWKSSLEISHVESEAAWNRNLHKAENFRSVPASLVNLVPTERGPSKRGLGGSYNLGNRKWRWATERWFQDTCFHGKHLGLLALFEENNGFGRSFTWPFQIRWYWRWPLNWPEQTSRAVSHWKYLTGLGLPWIFQLVGRINWNHGLRMVVLTCPHHRQKYLESSPILLIQLWDRPKVTTERHQDLLGKPSSVSISTSFNHVLHKHKTEPRPERHRLHQAWISYCFSMNSSTHELVRDSQLLHRVKDKSSRWMRTNEIEALKGWKDTCSYWTQKTPCAPTHSMKLLPNSTFGTVIWKPRNADERQEWLNLWSLRELYHTLSLLRARWIQVCPGFTQKLCDLPSERQRGYPNTCIRNADHLLVKSDTKSPFGTR